MSIAKKLLTASLFLIFIQSAKSQTPAAGWAEDLKTVRDDLPNFHPNFFKKITQKSWDEQFAALLNNLSGKSDLQIALELQRVIAQAGDPNTWLDVSQLLYKSKFIPVALGFYEGQFYVSASVRRFAPIFGTKVLKINGLTTTEAVDRAAQFVPKDNQIGYLTNAMQMLRFPIVNRMVGISQTDSLELLCEKLATGEQFKYKVWTLNPADDKQGMIPVVPQREAPEMIFRPLNKPFDLEWHARDSILIFRYVRCLSREILLESGDTATALQLPAFKTAADSAIAILRRCPTARLLFDLRFNPGGGASDGFRFATLLASDSLINQKNRLFVATNSATLSSATHVAVLFRNLTQATLVGEPTGDRPNHFGQPKQIYLPNTQLVVNYSSKYLQPVPTEEAPTLTPNVLIPMSFETFLRGGDPVLNWLRKN